ncbi:M20/M25/M40 family metallo-hydrolase [Curtobacterium sp. VKM Ac-2865]|uniref:M20 family metallopeptidase n=1 Tax=Curtobacterium sp. VKM Ac-2865 TaxID=2783817 RepID=UPI00188C1753|nr:M20/M25/M40 family metallo-hydrolase [Curtobacterium sp. VKM Ac-2865]MBF4582824.1 M20/M25/M40 family metallo-hydrolase [Curtobacterium sp. VKM Ac-2865]
MSVDVVDLTQHLVRIPSVSGSPGEAAVLDVLSRLFDDRYAVRTLAGPDGSLRAVAVVPAVPNGPLLVFTGHVDVVPTGDEALWTHPPFSGDLAEGRVWGRGTTDMKGGVAAIVAALDGAPDGASVAALFTVEEETGSRGAAEAATLLDGLEARLLVVAEPTDGRVVRGHRGVTWLRVVTDGVAAHGSTPHLGRNAITGLTRVLDRAATEGTGWDTLNVGTIGGGTAVNVVPDRAWAQVDLRTADPLADPAAWWREQPDLAAVESELTLPAVLLDPDDAEVRRLGIEPDDRIVGYFTDAAVLTGALGCDRVVLLGPGQTDLAHKRDESVSVDALHRAVVEYAGLIVRWGRKRP